MKPALLLATPECTAPRPSPTPCLTAAGHPPGRQAATEALSTPCYWALKLFPLFCCDKLRCNKHAAHKSPSYPLTSPSGASPGRSSCKKRNEAWRHAPSERPRSHVHLSNGPPLCPFPHQGHRSCKQRLRSSGRTLTFYTPVLCVFMAGVCGPGTLVF